ncbi:hypothetical protein HA402_015025 [Bradysia odoriphaga]|nr:hypothetical protein HA402_015025 [Bradysia odoriphaga]
MIASKCLTAEPIHIRRPSKCEIDRDRYTYNVYSEYDRRRTFVNWPKSYINTDQLAKFGFYHYGGDKVKCAFCNVVVRDWDESDSPLAEHLKHSSHCPLLNRQFTQNIPIDEDELNRSLPEISPDECSEMTCKHTPINKSEHHEHPDYILEHNRLKTFCNWPKSIRQRPAELVEAGFFYSGQGDMVICFSCGLGLRDWEIEDIPVVEHAKHTSQCSYLNLVKGEEFVKSIKKAESENDTTKKTVTRNVSIIGNEETSIENACKICYERVADILFQPCNHCASCGRCSVSLETCPVCRRTIERKTKIFFS